MYEILQLSTSVSQLGQGSVTIKLCPMPGVRHLLTM